MSCERWMNYIRNAEKSICCAGNIRKVHYKFKDDAEMIEEYSMETSILLRRLWKKKPHIFGIQTNHNEFNETLFNWDIELGEIVGPIYDTNFLFKETDKAVIVESLKDRNRNL